MIFIAGVHGVGKTYTCNQLKKDFVVYSASGLIEQYSKIHYSGYKKAYNIENNQRHLINIVGQMESHGEKFILDGHFCLFNADGEVEKISYEIIRQLHIEGIILIWDKEDIIQKRIQMRERKSDLLTLYEIVNLQEQEINYAQNVAQTLNIPLALINASNEDDIFKCEHFITSLWEDK